jgi:hypothetical protein
MSANGDWFSPTLHPPSFPLMQHPARKGLFSSPGKLLVCIPFESPHTLLPDNVLVAGGDCSFTYTAVASFRMVSAVVGCGCNRPSCPGVHPLTLPSHKTYLLCATRSSARAAVVSLLTSTLPHQPPITRRNLPLRPPFHLHLPHPVYFSKPLR